MKPNELAPVEHMAVVLSALRQRGGRAFRSGDLARWCQLCKRDVERAVQALRCSGEPIGSGNDGYYFINSLEGYHATRRQLRSRLITQYRTYRGLKKAEARYLPQGDLFIKETA